MNSYTQFALAALPWITMGLALAIFFARASKRKKETAPEENYGAEGMALGMSFGVALATAMHVDAGIGLSMGMLVGLVIGSGMERKD